METNPNSCRRKTKIVATIGPASNSPEKLLQLIKAGVNVFRLNFSHGTHAEHLTILQRIRAASAELGSPVGILQDLSGPKIRISEAVENLDPLLDGGSVLIKASNGSKSDNQTIQVEGLDPASFVKPGQSILLADGAIVLEAQAIQGDAVSCKIIRGAKLRSRIGIAFPESLLNLPAATDKDLVDLKWGIENGVDFVAISFVQNADDLVRLRAEITRLKGNVSVISKIERNLAIDNLEEILDLSDGIMVARGDLGLELPLEKLPRVQKMLIERANSRGMPVIVATQMLHSMVNSIRPTRAEVSDTAVAVMSGADAVMLSEETAIGNFPVESVEYLHRIALEAEKGFAFEEYKLRLRGVDRLIVPDAVAYAACAAALKINASAIIACTETGTSARLVAKYRPQQPLFGVTRNERTVQRMCLLWGVEPIPVTQANSSADELEIGLARVQKQWGFPQASLAVITGGKAVGTPGSTSMLEVREMNFKG
jgi:pyruvate kinase